MESKPMNPQSVIGNNDIGSDDNISDSNIEGSIAQTVQSSMQPQWGPNLTKNQKQKLRKKAAE